MAEEELSCLKMDEESIAGVESEGMGLQVLGNIHDNLLEDSMHILFGSLNKLSAYFVPLGLCMDLPGNSYVPLRLRLFEVEGLPLEV